MSTGIVFNYKNHLPSTPFPNLYSSLPFSDGIDITKNATELIKLTKRFDKTWQNWMYFKNKVIIGIILSKDSQSQIPYIIIDSVHILNLGNNTLLYLR